MKLLKGQEISDEILENLRNSIKSKGIKPTLAVFLIGDNPASELYINLKEEAANKVGIEFRRFEYREIGRSEVSRVEDEVVEKIQKLNQDFQVNAIMVQLPLPEGFNTQRVIDAIAPNKDVDGFHPINIQKFFDGKEYFWPVFPKALIAMLKASNEDLSGKQAVIIGNSKKFALVMEEALKREFIDSEFIFGSDLENGKQEAIEKCQKADIIITACGKPRLIKKEYLKGGVIIIDGGIKKEGKKVSGDVDLNEVSEKVSYISPVPGGVGPVTIACLLENVFVLNQLQN